MRVLIRPDQAGDSTMIRTRHTPEQIIRKLKTADHLIVQGKSVADVCRVLEVAQPTYHRWRQLYGGMKAEEAGNTPGDPRPAIHVVMAAAGWSDPAARVERTGASA